MLRDRWNPSRMKMLPLFSVGLLVFGLGLYLLGSASELVTSERSAILVGALIGVAGSLSLFVLRRRHERTVLRRALWAELSTIAPQIDEYGSIIYSHAPTEKLPIPPDIIVNTNYTANTTKIGLLSSDEAEAVVNYYTKAILVQRQIHRYNTDDTLDIGTAHGFTKDYIEMHSRLRVALRTIAEALDIPAEKRPSMKGLDPAEVSSDAGQAIERVATVVSKERESINDTEDRTQ